MKWMKGMFLLLAANILIMVTLSLTVPLLINIILPMFGIDLRGSVDLSSLVWALVLGFGGAFISLAFSKQMARAMLDCRQITQPRSQAEQVVYGSVQEIAALWEADVRCEPQLDASAREREMSGWHKALGRVMTSGL